MSAPAVPDELRAAEDDIMRAYLEVISQRGREAAAPAPPARNVGGDVAAEALVLHARRLRELGALSDLLLTALGSADPAELARARLATKDFARLLLAEDAGARLAADLAGMVPDLAAAGPAGPRLAELARGCLVLHRMAKESFQGKQTAGMVRAAPPPDAAGGAAPTTPSRTSDDEMLVLARWPDAVCCMGRGIWNAWDGDEGRLFIIGSGPTEAAAWADAARRLRAAAG